MAIACIGENSLDRAVRWLEIFHPENPRALDMLAGAIFNSLNPHPHTRLMAMFKAYFDASGNPKDHPYMVVAGYVANYLQWQRFEEEWDLAHSAYGVEKPFHMVEFQAALSQPRYRNQRNARADYIEIAKHSARAEEFLKRLNHIQMSFVQVGVSCIVPMDAYQDVNSVLDLQERVPPYALGARMCIQKLRNWEKQYQVRPPVECVFEVGDLEQAKFTNLMVDENEPSPIYKSKRDFAGLQGADQYAWEQFNFLRRNRNNSEYAPSKTCFFLLESIPKLSAYAPREFLIRLCEEKGIKPYVI